MVRNKTMLQNELRKDNGLARMLNRISRIENVKEEEIRKNEGLQYNR